MKKLLLSESALKGISGVEKFKFNPSKEYSIEMDKADNKIEEDRYKQKVFIRKLKKEFGK